MQVKFLLSKLTTMGTTPMRSNAGEFLKGNEIIPNTFMLPVSD